MPSLIELFNGGTLTDLNKEGTDLEDMSYTLLTLNANALFGGYDGEQATVQRVDPEGSKHGVMLSSGETLVFGNDEDVYQPR